MALPPGPRWPAPVQAAQFARDPLGFMRRCQERHGDVFLARFPGLGNVVYVADPAIAKEIFTASPRTLHTGAANAKWLEPALGRSSVMNLDEDEHMRQRRLLLPPYHGDRIRGYERAIVEIVEREIDSWPLNEPFSMLKATQRITLEVILTTVFGLGAERRNALRDAVLAFDRTAAWVLPLPPLRKDLGRFSPWRRFLAARERIDALFHAEIARGRSDPGLAEREDVLALLLQATDEDGKGLTDDEVRDEVMTLVAAGYETTATALAWAFERILRTPHVLARLQAAPGDPEYLRATVKETLRLRSPVTDGTRVLAHDAHVAGHDLPQGTLVIVALPLVHRRPETYPDPYAFNPERWLDIDPEPYAFLPFGGGVRRCIGAAFAQYELETALRTILSRARLRPARPRPEHPRMHHVIVVPSRGARVVLEERLAPGEVLVERGDVRPDHLREEAVQQPAQRA